MNRKEALKAYPDLGGADLSGADLGGADLSGANLGGADLRDADLPSPTMMLLAYWGEVSPGLCADLMRYDAANCPDGRKLFASWADGGPCPYSDLKIERVARFREAREHYKPGPAKSALNLMIAVLRETCKDSDYHRDCDRDLAIDGEGEESDGN